MTVGNAAHVRSLTLLPVQDTKAYLGVEFYFHTFLILTLDDVSGQIHSLAALSPPEETVLLVH